VHLTGEKRWHRPGGILEEVHVARVVWTALVCIVVGVAIGGAWRLWQYWQLYSTLAKLSEADDLGEPLRPDGRHLVAIRKLRFTWDTLVENGGPIVDPLTPYGSRDIADDLGSIIGTRNMEAIAKFHIEVARALSWALENGVLPEGRYPLAHLDNASIERAMMRGTERLSEVQIAQIRSEIPRLDPDRTFMFTAAHRALLKNLRFGWPRPALLAIFPRWGGQVVPIVNFKRPFGGMSSFDIDMAAILGLPRPASGGQFDPALWRLYTEMLPALQAFVEHGQIAVGQ
jgi:hypothetical protein